MNIGSLILNEEVFKFEEVLNYFKDFNSIFKVSKISNNKIVIDYNLLKYSMPKVEDRPNIYGLYIRKLGSEAWELKYIGQRKHNGILERLRQHLVSHHKQTGAKLENIENLKDEYDIGIKLFSVRPDAMRLYYEERLICDLGPKWNQQKHKIKNH